MAKNRGKKPRKSYPPTAAEAMKRKWRGREIELEEARREGRVEVTVDEDGWTCETITKKK